jgi:MFS transporter, PHS family, inorganic phosphate transporter
MTTIADPGDNVLARLDEAKVTPLHWKIMFISGMGFFTDAYDLFIIGVVMALLKQEWHFSSVAQGLVTSTALLASAVSAILFGRIADMLGRERIYGYEVLVLAAGAIASAFSPNIWWLILFRVILRIVAAEAGQLDDHERVCRQKNPRHDGEPRFRDAGGGADLRAIAGLGPVADEPVA